MDANKQQQNEAVFLASAWLLIREKGPEYVLQHGDPDVSRFRCEARVGCGKRQ
jgi:hypothetical protein